MAMSRRQFLGTTASAVLVAGTRARGPVFGANDRIGICCVGVRGRGQALIDGFRAVRGVEVVALADVDSNYRAERAGALERATGRRPRTLVDFREALADPAVDALAVATPNHWHALATVWACEAGKDVYVEKPMTHNVLEGPRVIEAAERHGRIVQHGTQQRSDGARIRDIRLLESGIIGEVYMARGLGYKNGNRGSIGFAPPEPPPRHLDWNLWQGPAQERAYCANYHPYTWHWFWDYGNGEIGNQGVHEMDVAVWGLGKGLPVEVHSTGGRYTYEDQGETPNTQVATFKYADGTLLVFEVRNRFTNDEAGVRVGNLFYGSDGYYVDGKGFFDTRDKPIRVQERAPRTAGPFASFIQAMRSRDPGDVRGTPEEAHVSCAHCHLANISYRLGRTVQFDPATLACPGDAEANALLTRDYRTGFTFAEPV